MSQLGKRWITMMPRYYSSAIYFFSFFWQYNDDIHKTLHNRQKVTYPEVVWHRLHHEERIPGAVRSRSRRRHDGGAGTPGGRPPSPTAPVHGRAVRVGRHSGAARRAPGRRRARSHGSHWRHRPAGRRTAHRKVTAVRSHRAHRPAWPPRRCHAVAHSRRS